MYDMSPRIPSEEKVLFLYAKDNNPYPNGGAHWHTCLVPSEYKSGGQPFCGLLAINVVSLVEVNAICLFGRASTKLGSS